MKIIENIMRKLAKVQAKFPLIVILVMLTLSLFFAYYAVRIESDASFKVMYPDWSDTIVLGDLVDNEFGGTDTLFIYAKIDDSVTDTQRIQDIRHPDVLKAMQDLQRSLATETFVASTNSLADLYIQFHGRLPETLEESKQMLAEFPEEVRTQHLGSFLSSDYQFANMFVSVSVQNIPGYLEKIESNVREKVAQTPFPIGVKATLTGEPILINRIMKYLIDDNMSTILLAIIAVVCILWIYFRSLKIALISAVPTVLTLVWLAGTLYMLDIRITMMIASIGAMMIGMSVDYAIHLTHAFHHRIKEGKENAAEETVVGVGTALTASVSTTIAGFLAMLIGVTPNSQVQGTVLAIGVLWAFIISIVLLPPLMILQRKFVYTKLDETLFRIIGREEVTKKGVIDIVLAKLAWFQAKHPVTILILAAIFTILIIPGFGFVYIDTEGENWVPDGDDVVEALDEMGGNFGGTASVNFLFALDKGEGNIDADAINDLRDPRFLQQLATLDTIISDISWVDQVDSPTQAIRRVNNGRIPNTYEEIKTLIADNPNVDFRFNEDYSIAILTPRADILDEPEFYEIMSELDGLTFPKEISIIPQGGTVEYIELNNILGQDTMLTAGIGFIFVIIIASLFYMSLVSGLLAFFPIILAIIWTIGTMGYIGLPFTVLTTGMLAILMGMGIDFSIHLIHGIRDALKQHGIEEALHLALMSTGQAITITTITTIVGFLSLSFATLVNTMRLGWTLALGIAATFFSTMIIVPAVLALQHRLQRRNKK